jgi:ATPase family associated with various cellular activities (AAA)
MSKLRTMLDNLALAQLAAASPSYVIPTTATLCPVVGDIPADELEADTYERETVRKRFAALTTELPLLEASALRRHASGELAAVMQLRREAPWLEPIIGVIECQLERQLVRGQPWVKFGPILLVGAPGVGKSWVARRIAEVCGLKISTADLAATSDAMQVAGVARGWTNAQPCLPATAMALSASANPAIIVEEVEKAGRSERNGDPVAAMLNLIEPGTAQRYYDRCLQTEVDVSQVSWIMTANAITERLPKPLLSRLEIIEVTAPPVAQFDALLDQLTGSLAQRWQLPIERAPLLPTSVIVTLRRDYARHRSIRRLARLVERVGTLCIPEPQRH